MIKVVYILNTLLFCLLMAGYTVLHPTLGSLVSGETYHFLPFFLPIFLVTFGVVDVSGQRPLDLGRLRGSRESKVETF